MVYIYISDSARNRSQDICPPISQIVLKSFIKISIIINDFFFLVFNATFSNISAISWRPVLVVEEAGVPGENHRPWASNW